jgi:coenzyme F420-reducing hydrogenase delta subunit
MAEENDYKIIAYCCEHCAYAAADLAGSLRIQYPPEVRIVQLPCTGKLDILLVLEAFEKGIDGVMVAG